MSLDLGHLGEKRKEENHLEIFKMNILQELVPTKVGIAGNEKARLFLSLAWMLGDK
jgi:hypothetical protein